ncbi:protein-disulfide reductase DsbD family protein [Balneolaceae bacterium ANBcel3]|nr:protein-disulfide reductase DsbD family protein [Balneolaceae bacterium ANBcel3]
MRNFSLLWIYILFAVSFCMPASAFSNSFMENSGPRYATVSLFPETPEIHSSDSSFLIGVHLNIKDGWHIYWKNPGDSGLATSIRWDDHPILTPKDILWPFPSRFDEEGVTTYGYSDSVTLLIPVEVDYSNSSVDSNPVLKAQIQWLACKDICVSESTEASIEIGLASDSPDYSISGKTKISNALEKIPASLSGIRASAKKENRLFKINLVPDKDFSHFSNKDEFYFYSSESGIIEHSVLQVVHVDNGIIDMEIQSSRYLNHEIRYLEGVLVGYSSKDDNTKHIAITLDIPVYND